MITTAPPLSASFMIIDSSFDRDFIAFLSAKDTLYFTFVLDLVVGVFCRFSVYSSNAVLRFFGGIKYIYIYSLKYNTKKMKIF